MAKYKYTTASATASATTPVKKEGKDSKKHEETELYEYKNDNGSKEKPSLVAYKNTVSTEDATNSESDQALVRFITDREALMKNAFTTEGHDRRFKEAEMLFNEHLTTVSYTASFPFMGVRDVWQKLKPTQWDVIPETESGMFPSRVVYKAMNHELKRGGFNSTFKKNYLSTCIYGEAYRELGFVESNDDGYTGVVFSNINPTEILIDERCQQFISEAGKGDAVDCLLKFSLAEEDFKSVFKDNTVKVNGRTYEAYKNTEYVLCGSIDGDTKGYEKESKFVDVWFYYNRVQDRQVVIAGSNRRVIRDIPLFTRIGNRKVLPVFQFTFMPIAGKNRFQGIPAMIRNLNRMKSEGVRLAAEHAFEMGKTMTLINSGAEIDRDALARRDPFVEVFVPQGADPNSLFMQHNLQPLGAEYYNLMLGTLDNEAVARIGSDFNTFTQEPKHASTSLNRNEFTDSMIRNIMEKNEEEGETFFLKTLMYLIIDGYSDRKWSEALGLEDYTKLQEVVSVFKYKSIREYLSDNIESTDVSVVVGSIVSPNQQVRRQQYTELLNSIPPTHPAFAPAVDELAMLVMPSKAPEIKQAIKEAKEQQNMQMQSTQAQINSQNAAAQASANQGNGANSAGATANNGGTTGQPTATANTTQEAVQRMLRDQTNVAKNMSGGMMPA